MHSEPAPGDRNFLFVAGCARSGTTALTNLLNQHADLAISIERFNRITEPRA
ncbi:MAG: hypothetical protein HKN26_10355, partial [Acidimicrobiales bacterium]|nr:hypothetical protein [Acidimicrobiales bacterium]